MENDFLARDLSKVWHPFTPVPHMGPRAVFVRASGSYLYDQSGRRYFDATSSWWCTLHGHCHPRLVSAIARQAEQLDQVLFAPHTHPVAVELAEQLLLVAGQSFSHVFYSDDGSTAVEAALKMAVQYWHNRGQLERNQFVSLEGAYHGDTLGAVSVSHIPKYHDHFSSILKASYKATQPYCYRCSLNLEFPSCATKCLDEALVYLEKYHSQVAAFIVEPLVLGAAGMIVYPAEYLERIVSLCRDRGILVIFDEVFTGFGRTGSFFAMDQVAHKPDILCLSKGLSGGMLPLGATLVAPHVFESFSGSPEKAFYHGHTFTGNAISCAVALENIKVIHEERVLERNKLLIEVFHRAKAMFENLPHVGEVRHIGMIWAIELVLEKKAKARFEQADATGWVIAEQLWQKGIWLRPLHNTLYVVPPYSTAPEELRHVLQVIYSTLKEMKLFKG